MKAKTDLGWMNGWREDPVEYLSHQETCGEWRPLPSGVEVKIYPSLTVEKIGRCAEKFTCSKCGIEFRVDSSD